MEKISNSSNENCEMGKIVRVGVCFESEVKLNEKPRELFSMFPKFETLGSNWSIEGFR